MFGQTQRVLYINFYDAVLYCRCKKNIERQLIVFIYNNGGVLGGLPKSNSSHGRCEAWRKAGDALHPFSTDSEICKYMEMMFRRKRKK